jgi:tRNA dimethylallyltransferase
MTPATPPRPIVIVGPTAGGKSELAVALAEWFHGEVLSADSMQVYRHLDAGTAKPAAELRARVPHHLIDIVEPTQRFTVADWLAQAEALIASLQARGVRPIVVGGTNLYLKAMLEGMFTPAPAEARHDGSRDDAGACGIDPAFRASLAAVPGAELHQRLLTVDPSAAQRIHPNDRKKLTRALEVFHLTGRPISAWQTQWQPAACGAAEPAPAYRHDPILLGLDWPVEAINRRINARVRQMFFPAASAESLPDEVRRLDAAGLLGPQARQALGYKQVLEHLQGGLTLDEAVEKTKILTRRFAKGQRNWLRRYRGVVWLPAAEPDAPALAAAARDRITAAGQTIYT